MRNRDLLHIRHALRLQGNPEAMASFNECQDIAVGIKVIAYVRIPAGNGTVGGYKVTEGPRTIETTRSFYCAVERLLS